MNTIRFNLTFALIIVFCTMGMNAQTMRDTLKNILFGKYFDNNFTLQDFDRVFNIKSVYTTFKKPHSVIQGINYHFIDKDSSVIRLEIELDNKQGKLFTLSNGCISSQEFRQKFIKSIKITHWSKPTDEEITSNMEFIRLVYCE